MSEIFSASNLKTAAVVTIAMMIAANFTGSQSNLVRGGAMFAAALAGGYAASKL